MSAPRLSRSLAYLAASLVLFASAAPLSAWMQGRRLEAGLAPGEGLADPGTLLGGVALAGFRPMAINYFWVKATSLIAKKDWWELRPLFELLSKLQPHNAQVWVFNAWNMAYNIPVDLPTTADRWKWVREGIEFCDRGRKKNPVADEVDLFQSQILHHRVWMHPSMVELVERRWGESPQRLALRTIDRAYARPEHHPQVCLQRLGVLRRLVYVVLAQDDDLAGARRISGEMGELGRHIARAHPRVKLDVRPPELRDLMEEAAQFWERQVFDILRDELREDLHQAKSPGADLERRWQACRARLEQSARVWDRLAARMREERAELEAASRAGLEALRPEREREFLLASARRFNEDWERMARALARATRARSALQPAVWRLFQVERAGVPLPILRDELRPALLALRAFLVRESEALAVPDCKKTLADAAGATTY